RQLCFGRPEGGTTYGSLKSSAYHRISHVDRHSQWVTGYPQRTSPLRSHAVRVRQRPYLRASGQDDGTAP
ncbi:MAG: hypothetical protein PHC30_01955, partial [Lentisphaeria bacterium]|nr:hypothetical protein [Lentisphaeria bacterium]